MEIAYAELIFDINVVSFNPGKPPFTTAPAEDCYEGEEAVVEFEITDIRPDLDGSTNSDLNYDLKVINFYNNDETLTELILEEMME